MEEKRTITLRIKKVYFDKILSGEKKVEYRDLKDYYVKLFEGQEIGALKLHYQGQESLIIDVEKIELIEKPENLNQSFFTSSKVFAIYLGSKINHTVKGE